MATDSAFVIALWVGGGGVFLLAVLFGIYLYRNWKQNTVRFTILGLDGKERHKRIKNPNQTNTVFGNTYVYDEEAQTRDFWGKKIYYFDGVPDPIIFNRKNHNVKLSSKALNSIVEDDFIKKLFNPSDALSVENILAYITIGLVAIMLYFLLFENISIDIATNDANIDLIKKACRQAITGG